MPENTEKSEILYQSIFSWHNINHVSRGKKGEAFQNGLIMKSIAYTNVCRLENLCSSSL